MNFLKRIDKEAKLMIIASIIILLAFFLYLKLVGVPLTQSRNHLNQGVIYYEEKKYQQAKAEIEESIQIWRTEEAEDYLSLVNEQLAK